jgi:hypothetical protein
LAVVDTEVAQPPEPEEETVGEGTRFFLQIQSNARVGDLAAGGIGGMGGFDFEAGSLGGVPDALVGVRVGRLTFALGVTFSQINSSMQGFDSCGLAPGPQQLATTQTLFGVIPTMRFDALRTPDGRGRFEVGANIPLLLSSRSQEQFDVCRDFTMPAPIITDEATDGIYGLAALIAGRYHVWPALAVGAELGFSYLVFDFDDDPDTMFDEPSVTTLGFHTGLTLSIEVPL